MKSDRSAARRLAREEILLVELQRDHGYMFIRMPREEDRSSMHFSVDKKTRKAKLTPSRVARVSVPDGSWLGRQISADDRKPARAESRTSNRRAKGTE